MFKLLILIIFLTFFIQIYASRSVNRSKRNTIQFGRMISHLLNLGSFIPLEAFEMFNGYGCWCGIGGSGKPVDEIDKCCLEHDQCYDKVILNKCKYNKLPYWVLYDKETSHGQIVCTDENETCDYKTCQCDKLAAECFAKNYASYNQSNIDYCPTKGQCSPGTYSHKDSCLNCDCNYIASDYGSTKCTICPLGMISNYERTQCIACSPNLGGWIQDWMDSGCRDCKNCECNYLAHTGSNKCIRCQPGSISNSDSSECIKCSPGTVMVSGYGLCNKCFPCGYVNYIAPNPGMTECERCPSGSVANENKTECVKCFPGFFQRPDYPEDCVRCNSNDYIAPGFGSTECTKCPPRKKANKERTACI